ncbi:MAG: ssDNA-binding domain-containing protein, partial [Oscillospiraceae bacterium]|nr:ssDNA-binding domain-containing protein [Oscillospiraceae bacterium]
MFLLSKIETIKESWSEIIDRLRSDKQELAQFLRFAAGMYKQSFSDAVLIYHQNPNATKVATLETWNKLGRLVNKGEHSIAVFGEDSRAKHLFDISQTNGKRIPELWKLTEDLSSELTAVINKKYGRDCKNIQETIAAMSVDNIRPHLSEMMYATGQLKLTDNDLKTYQQSVVSAVRFMVSTRCAPTVGLENSDMKISGGINLNAADLFKDNRDLIRFCDLVQKSAKDTLLEMEREIVQILRKRREKSNELQTKPDRTVSSRT